MKKYSTISLSIVLLAGITIGAAFWARLFFTALQTYRSPVHPVELFAQPSTPPLTNRVVMVVIGGLGYDDSLALDMPVLAQLRRAGAAFAVESSPPTYSQTAWATLLTGAPPDTNNAPPVNLPPEKLRPLQVDTIFSRAQQAGQKTAVLASTEWQTLLAAEQIGFTFFVNAFDPQADRLVVETALPVIESTPSGLVLVYLSELDFIGRNFGGPDSPAYRQAAQQVDAYLGRLWAATDLSHSVLVVLSDHGQMGNGGRGGNEVEVIWQPLVLIGEHIIPGDYSDIHQTDIAPTVSALLGLPPPALARGRILFETLELSEQDRAAIQLSLARQRIDLARAYLAQIQSTPAPLPDQLVTDLRQAERTLIAKNPDGALQLGLLARQEADARINAAKSNRLQAEQRARLAIVLPAGLVWLILIWRRRGRHTGSVIVAAAIAAGLFHALFRLQGYGYSVSSIGNFTDFAFDATRWAAVGLLAGGGILLLLLLLANESDWLTLLGTGYGFGVLVTFVFALPLGWAFWQNGLAPTWHLPEIVTAFWQILALIQVMVSAVLGLLLPWPIMVFAVFVHQIRRRLSKTRPQPGADILPGLRL